MSPAPRRWLQAELLPADPDAELEELAGLALLGLLPFGCLGVEEQGQRLLAFFPESTERGALEVALRDADCGLGLGETTAVEDPGWVEAFHRSLEPIDVGRRFTILPGAGGEPGPGRLALRFEPGRAFGTGHHESTRLALTWIEDTLSPGARVLDVGTGTGILAAAAVLLGAEDVLATDCDPEAVEVAEATLLALPEGRRVRLEVAEGPGAARGPFELVVANITADVLKPMLPELAARRAPGGALVLAGLLLTDRAGIEDELSRLGLRCDWREEGEWASCRAREA